MERLRKNAWWWYVSLLILVGFYRLLRWPIEPFDTDLWYHLNGGRYIFQNHSIPSTSFFSFISPPRIWTDYYWLFQALVYWIYSHFDYHGLIALRALLYLATVSLAWLFLLKDRSENAPRSYFVVLGSFSLAVLIQRYLFVRPHIFTYFLLALFIYIVESGSKWRMWLLPWIALLWSNLHGVTYPIILWISGSYLSEYFWRRWRGKPTGQGDEFFFLLPLVFSMLAIYMTPHGFHLMGIPFMPMDYVSQTVSELIITWDQMLSIEISHMVPSYDTLFNLLAVFACSAAAISLMNRNARLSHLLLCIGGGVLLARGSRFMPDFVLLALPVLKNNPLWRSDAFGDRSSRFLRLFFFGLLAMMPILFLRARFSNRPKYPFSQRGLPCGIAAFLKRVDAGGSILNSPNDGGYLQWMLYPRYKIFTDMQTPFLFSDEDYYVGVNVFTDEKVLAGVLSKYKPDFISVPIQNNGPVTSFKYRMRKFPDYAAVFFDDAEVLYVHKRRHAGLFASYGLKDLDPFELVLYPETSIADKKKRERVSKYIPKLLEIYPNGLTANYLAAALHEKKGSFSEMSAHAEVIVANFPELPMGYVLKGDAFKGLKRFGQAVSSYERALERLADSGKMSIYREMGLAYLEQNDYGKAYKTFKKCLYFSLGPEFLKNYDLLDLSAHLAGERREMQKTTTFLSDLRRTYPGLFRK